MITFEKDPVLGVSKTLANSKAMIAIPVELGKVARKSLQVELGGADGGDSLKVTIVNRGQL